MSSGSNEPSFSDPIPEIAESICAQFLFDAKTLLKLGETSSVWHKFCNDPKIWECLNNERFGPEALPPPATAPSSLPGWRFFPGMDSPGNDCASPNDVDGQPTPTALAALADARNGCAFNTNGWVKHGLLPLFRWERFSFQPGVGMYVREASTVLNLGLPPPVERAAAEELSAEQLERPPDFPGWVFYWLQDSPANDISHPATGELHFKSTCASLEELSRLAAAYPGCVAFNTDGALKRDLHPQTHWRRTSGSTSWAGLYVRQDVVEARGLLRPQPATGAPILPMLRYFQRSRTRLLAARDVDVTWLNGTYLLVRPDPVTPPAAASVAAGQPPRLHDSDSDPDANDADDGDDGDDGGGSNGQPGSWRLLPEQRTRSLDMGTRMRPGWRQPGGTRPERGLPSSGPWGLQQGGGGSPAGRGPRGSNGGSGEGTEPVGDSSSAAAAAAVRPMQVVELRNVCWLNLEGSFYGVGPGRYRCVWWLLATPDCNVDEFSVRITRSAARTCPQTGRLTQPGSRGGTASASAAASAAAASSAVSSSEDPTKRPTLSTMVVPWQELKRHATGVWYGHECGRFEVPAGQVVDVVVTLWDHSGYWKRGLMFKQLELVTED